MINAAKRSTPECTDYDSRPNWGQCLTCCVEVERTKVHVAILFQQSPWRARQKQNFRDHIACKFITNNMRLCSGRPLRYCRHAYVNGSGGALANRRPPRPHLVGWTALGRPVCLEKAEDGGNTEDPTLAELACRISQNGHYQPHSINPISANPPAPYYVRFPLILLQKSFCTGVENSAGCRCDFRVKMRGVSSVHVKLTSDIANTSEAIRIGDCFSFDSFAKNSSLCNFRLLQQYPSPIGPRRCLRALLRSANLGLVHCIKVPR
jgi:hypothetical protein